MHSTYTNAEGEEVLTFGTVENTNQNKAKLAGTVPATTIDVDLVVGKDHLNLIQRRRVPMGLEYGAVALPPAEPLPSLPFPIAPGVARAHRQITRRRISTGGTTGRL